MLQGFVVELLSPDDMHRVAGVMAGVRRDICHFAPEIETGKTGVRVAILAQTFVPALVTHGSRWTHGTRVKALNW